jgi:hypothetical protein
MDGDRRPNQDNDHENYDHGARRELVYGRRLRVLRCLFQTHFREAEDMEAQRAILAGSKFKLDD